MNIANFGLAKQLSAAGGASQAMPALTQPGLAIGTPDYAAPICMRWA